VEVGEGLVRIAKEANPAHQFDQRCEEEHVVLTHHKGQLAKVWVVRNLLSSPTSTRRCPHDMPPINQEVQRTRTCIEECPHLNEVALSMVHR